MKNTGETSAFSPLFGESAMKAASGAEKVLALLVTQFVCEPLTNVLLHPGGNPGRLAESKFSDSGVAGVRTPSGLTNCTVPKIRGAILKLQRRRHRAAADARR